MTETRELQDARVARATARRTWRCPCGQTGAASNVTLALAELDAHRQLEHPDRPLIGDVGSDAS